MNNLKEALDAFSSKLESKKRFFEHEIEKWKSRGKTTLYEKAQSLLSMLEKKLAEIKELISQGEAKESALKARLKTCKKLYKQLREITKPSWRQWLEALIIAGSVAIVLRYFVFGLYHVPTGSAEPTILVGDRVWGNKLAYWFDEVKRGDQVIFEDPRFKFDESNWVKTVWQKYVGLPIPLLGVEAGPINMVKRVIAVPGDWIEGRVEEDGHTAIYINDKKLGEPYVNPYPLIWLDKKVGFIPFFAKRSVPDGFWCTYVPNKSFEDQPYYNMKRSEVIAIPGYSHLRPPHVPCKKDVFGPVKVPVNKYWVMGDSRQNSHDSRWFGFLDKKFIQGRLSFIIYSVDSLESFWMFELIKTPISFWTKAIRWNRFFKWSKVYPERVV